MDKNIYRFRIIVLSLFISLMVGSTLSAALSDPINQTFSEYNNLTKADNVVEVAQEINQWIGGMFGIGILVILGFLLFGVSQFFTNSVSSQFLFTGFMLSIISVFLRIMELLSDLPFYMILSVTVVAVAIKVFSK